MLELLQLVTLINQCAPDVHPETMLAVVQTESRGEPLAVNVNSKGVARPRQPRTVEEAVELVRSLRQAGINFDAGLAQINSANFEWLGLTEQSVFDPCSNLAAGAKVLESNFAKAPAAKSEQASPLEQAANVVQERLDAALSAYNTGDFMKGITNGYVAKVRESGRKYAVPALRPETAEPAAVAVQVFKDGSAPAQTPSTPTWDVFGRPAEGVMVFEK